MPKRRAVAKAFLSVARSLSNSNSLRAAKRALCSTDHAGPAGRRLQKDAIESQILGPSVQAGNPG